MSPKHTFESVVGRLREGLTNGTIVLPAEHVDPEAMKPRTSPVAKAWWRRAAAESELSMDLPIWLDDELLQKAFTIALLVHPHREKAKGVIRQAMKWLGSSTASAERTLIDRIKHGRSETSLVLLGPPLFQRLVYKASDMIDLQEKGEDKYRLPEEAMLVRYLQYLLLLLLHRSSRWVAVAISQLVYAYDGTETNELMVPISGAWGDRERKRAKEKLMKRLAERFTELRPVPAKDGEYAHFEPSPNQGRLLPLVKQWLSLFKPWGTAHVLDEGSDPRKKQPAALRPGPRLDLEADLLELNRFHVFLDPLCFERLVACFGYALPSENLRLPFLVRCDEGSGGGGLLDPGTPSLGGPPSQSHLDSKELKDLREEFGAEQLRRRRLVTGSLAIRVDGSSRGALDLSSSNRARVTLPPESDVIEVYGRDKEGEVLVATHLVQYTVDGEIAPSRAKVKLGGAASLSFNIRGSASRGSENGLCELSYTSAPAVTPVSSIGRIPLYAALAIVAVLGAWLVTDAIGRMSTPHEHQLAAELARVRSERDALDKRLEAAIGGVHSFDLKPLSPGVSLGQRKSSEPQTTDTFGRINIPRTTQTMSLALAAPGRPYPSYRAILQRFESSENLVVQTELKMTERSEQRIVPWILSSAALEEGGYLIQLDGIDEHGEAHRLTVFGFWLHRE